MVTLLVSALVSQQHLTPVLITPPWNNVFYQFLELHLFLIFSLSLWLLSSAGSSFSIPPLSDGALPVTSLSLFFFLCRLTLLDPMHSHGLVYSLLLDFSFTICISSPEFFFEFHSYGYRCIHDTSVWMPELCESYLKFNMSKVVLLIFHASSSNHAPIFHIFINSTTLFLILYRNLEAILDSTLCLTSSTPCHIQPISWFYPFSFLKLP